MLCWYIVLQSLFASVLKIKYAFYITIYISSLQSNITNYAFLQNKSLTRFELYSWDIIRVHGPCYNNPRMPSPSHPVSLSAAISLQTRPTSLSLLPRSAFFPRRSGHALGPAWSHRALWQMRKTNVKFYSNRIWNGFGNKCGIRIEYWIEYEYSVASSSIRTAKLELFVFFKFAIL